MTMLSDLHSDTRLLSRVVKVGVDGSTRLQPVQAFPADPNRRKLLISVAGGAYNDPRDLSIALWYSADNDLRFYANNAKLTTGHKDASGLGNHSTYQGQDAVVVSNAGGKTNAARWILSGGFMFLPVGIMDGSASGEIFMSLKRDNTGGQRSHYSIGSNPGASDANYYPFGASVFDNFGLATNERQSYAYSENLATYNYYGVSAQAGANGWNMRLNNVVRKTYTPVGAIAWNHAPSLWIGERNGGIDQPNVEPFTGEAAMVVMKRDGIFTPAQRTTLVAYADANPGGGIPLDPNVNLVVASGKSEALFAGSFASSYGLFEIPDHTGEVWFYDPTGTSLSNVNVWSLTT